METRLNVTLTLALLFFSGAFTPARSAQPTSVSAPLIYKGAADGSAAVALDTNCFASASDEDSTIRIYRRDRGGAPVQTLDLTRFLEVSAASPETDIEAAARMGDRVYWISSHGRNQRGEFRSAHQRFFATDIGKGSPPQLVPAGRPYKNLSTDLASEPLLKDFNFAAAATRTPKQKGALSIEGLCATPDKHLLIGFRNPVPDGLALLIPLLNPEEMLAGGRAKFGSPIRLGLDGLGVRDITFWDGKFVIIAGPFDGKGPSELYEWKGGDAKAKQVKGARLKGLNPEAIIVYPDTGLKQIQLLSDDSKEEKKSFLGVVLFGRDFRSVWVTR